MKAYIIERPSTFLGEICQCLELEENKHIFITSTALGELEAFSFGNPKGCNMFKILSEGFDNFKHFKENIKLDHSNIKNISLSPAIKTGSKGYLFDVYLSSKKNVYKLSVLFETTPLPNAKLRLVDNCAVFKQYSSINEIINMEISSDFLYVLYRSSQNKFCFKIGDLNTAGDNNNIGAKSAIKNVNDTDLDSTFDCRNININNKPCYFLLSQVTKNHTPNCVTIYYATGDNFLYKIDYSKNTLDFMSKLSPDENYSIYSDVNYKFSNFEVGCGFPFFNSKTPQGNPCVKLISSPASITPSVLILDKGSSTDIHLKIAKFGPIYFNDNKDKCSVLFGVDVNNKIHVRHRYATKVEKIDKHEILDACWAFDGNSIFMTTTKKQALLFKFNPSLENTILTRRFPDLRKEITDEFVDKMKGLFVGSENSNTSVLQLKDEMGKYVTQKAVPIVAPTERHTHKSTVNKNKEEPKVEPEDSKSNDNSNKKNSTDNLPAEKNDKDFAAEYESLWKNRNPVMQSAKGYANFIDNFDKTKLPPGIQSLVTNDKSKSTTPTNGGNTNNESLKDDKKPLNSKDEDLRTSETSPQNIPDNNLLKNKSTNNSMNVNGLPTAPAKTRDDILKQKTPVTSQTNIKTNSSLPPAVTKQNKETTELAKKETEQIGVNARSNYKDGVVEINKNGSEIVFDDKALNKMVEEGSAIEKSKVSKPEDNGKNIKSDKINETENTDQIVHTATTNSSSNLIQDTQDTEETDFLPNIKTRSSIFSSETKEETSNTHDKVDDNSSEKNGLESVPESKIPDNNNKPDSSISTANPVENNTNNNETKITKSNSLETKQSNISSITDDNKSKSLPAVDKIPLEKADESKLSSNFSTQEQKIEQTISKTASESKNILQSNSDISNAGEKTVIPNSDKPNKPIFVQKQPEFIDLSIDDDYINNICSSNKIAESRKDNRFFKMDIPEDFASNIKSNSANNIQNDPANIQEMEEKKQESNKLLNTLKENISTANITNGFSTMNRTTEKTPIETEKQQKQGEGEKQSSEKTTNNNTTTSAKIELESNNLPDSESVTMKFHGPSYIVPKDLKRKLIEVDPLKPEIPVKKQKKDLEQIEFSDKLLINPIVAFSKIRLSIPKTRSAFETTILEKYKIEVINGNGTEQNPTKISIVSINKNENKNSTVNDSESPLFKSYQFFPKNITLTTGTSKFFAFCTENGIINVCSAKTGMRLQQPLVLGVPISFLESSGDFLACITTIGNAYCWNIKEMRLEYPMFSLYPILSPSMRASNDILSRAENITGLSVTNSGIVLVTLSNGDAFLYDKMMQTWSLINDSWWAYSSRYWDASNNKAGLLSSNLKEKRDRTEGESVMKMLEYKTNEELKRKGVTKLLQNFAKTMLLKEGFENLEQSVSISHLVNKMFVYMKFEEYDNYKDTLLTLCSTLAEFDMIDKLNEVFEFLFGEDGFNENIGYLKKHDLLRSVIVLVHQTGSQECKRLARMYADELDMV